MRIKKNYDTEEGRQFWNKIEGWLGIPPGMPTVAEKPKPAKRAGGKAKSRRAAAGAQNAS